MTELKVLKFSIFEQFPELVHGVSSSDFGNLSYKWAETNAQTPEDVRQARQRFFNQLAVPEQKVVATQVVSGVQIHNLTPKDWGKGIINPDEGILGDGFFTAEPDTYLFVITGDCLALFFYDPVKRVCGLIHAGWRGVDQELPGLAVEYMVNTYKCDPNNIRIGVSPGLQKESATFTHFNDFNQANLPNWQQYLEKTDSVYRADWIQYAKDQLAAAGVPTINIEDCGINTRTNTEYYSHRRALEEKVPEARFGALIGFQK